MTDTLLLSRDRDGGLPHPDKFGAPLILGEIAFASWVSGANPTAEVLDQSTAQLVSSQAVGCTLDLTNGTIAVSRDGIYEIELVLAKVSAASASGVMDFTVQKNGSALSPTITLGLLQPAVAANSMSAVAKGYASLVKGDLLRVVVTGTVGGVITLTAGRFSARMASDVTAYTQV